MKCNKVLASGVFLKRHFFAASYLFLSPLLSFLLTSKALLQFAHSCSDMRIAE